MSDPGPLPPFLKRERVSPDAQGRLQCADPFSMAELAYISGEAFLTKTVRRLDKWMEDAGAIRPYAYWIELTKFGPLFHVSEV